jgi:hypothetical protein
VPVNVVRVQVNTVEMNRLWGHNGEIAVYLRGRAEAIRRRQQSLAAVRTGAMRASVTVFGPYVDVLEIRYHVGPTATSPTGYPYPLAVEFGTSRMAAQPFIRPSAEAVTGVISGQTTTGTAWATGRRG